jgi:cytochrome c-type biogenesis protein CcmH
MISAILLVAITPLFSAAQIHAQSSDSTSDAPPTVTIGPDQDREFEKRAQGLEKSLICPICPGETLDQSFVQISQDMKRILREKLLEGQDEDQIKDFFVARYGTSVLAAPPRSGFNLVTWLVPPAGVAVGIVLLIVVMRQMRRGSGTVVAAGVGGSVPDDGEEGELSDYLAEVDRDLSLGDDSPDHEQDDEPDDPDDATGLRERSSQD